MKIKLHPPTSSGAWHFSEDAQGVLTIVWLEDGYEPEGKNVPRGTSEEN